MEGNEEGTGKRKVHVLFFSYDILSPEKYVCGHRMNQFIARWKGFETNSCKWDIRAETTNLTRAKAYQYFDHIHKPDLIIAQQFAIEHGALLATQLNIPLAYMIYNVSEYEHFYKDDSKQLQQPNVVFCWNARVRDALSERLPFAHLVNMEEFANWEWLENSFTSQERTFWDIILRKVSIIVPCHGAHIYFLSNVLSQISRFVVKPYQVVISLSPSPDQLASWDSYFQILPAVLHEVDTKFRKSGFLLEIHWSMSPKTAAENRNIAALNSTGDILIAIDADDDYHPQMVQVIEKIWRIRNPKEVHWQYTYGTANKPINAIEIVEGKKIHEIHHPDGKPCFDPLNWKGNAVNPPVAMGHCALSREVWKCFPWPDIIGGEDTMLHRQVCWHYPKDCVWLLSELTSYRQSRSVGL